MADSIILSESELFDLTGYKLATKQLRVLHARGFLRAYIGRSGVVLERTHYEAVLERLAAPPESVSAMRPDEPPSIHWRARPEHQARLAEERQRWLEQRAEHEALEQQVSAEFAEWELEQQKLRPIRRAALVRYHTAKRRTVKLQRTPAWADLEAIRAIYERAQELTRSSGIAHHVDHEIPLQGKLVSGLHVPNNLQILTATENSKKRNRYEV